MARQGGQCATPGCRHTHLEIHHVIWWSWGGTTNLDILIGLCTRCRHLLHRGLLNITGTATTGHIFTNRDNQPLLAAYRQRQNIHRKNWHTRQTVMDNETRHRKHTTTMRS